MNCELCKKCLGSPNCIDKLCAYCCTDNNCERHKRKKKKKKKVSIRNKIDTFVEYYDDEQIEEIKDVLFKKDLPMDVVNIIIDLVDDRDICCECERKVIDRVICESCNNPVCDSCFSHEIFKKCPHDDCPYCRYGSCFNNKLLFYCDTCYEILDDDDKIDDFDFLRITGLNNEDDEINSDNSDCETNSEANNDSDCEANNINENDNKNTNFDNENSVVTEITKKKKTKINIIDELNSKKQIRKNNLIEALETHGLKLRKDSKLCEGYIDGILDVTIPEIVERMCQMKYLYNYCDMNKIYKETKNEKNKNPYLFCYKSIFDVAERKALMKNNGNYPEQWPWLKYDVN